MVFHSIQTLCIAHFDIVSPRHVQYKKAAFPQLLWYILPLHISSLRRALCSKASCCLPQRADNPHVDISCLLHARYSVTCFRQQPLNTQPARSVFLLHALCSIATCCLPQHESSPRVGNACLPHALCSAKCFLLLLSHIQPSHSACRPRDLYNTCSCCLLQHVDSLHAGNAFRPHEKYIALFCPLRREDTRYVHNGSPLRARYSTPCFPPRLCGNPRAHSACRHHA
mmetsp:Transcript_37569/g.70465  ORF Transcript_37569/g.70465 Transcript_37569/m.70465 type:complete len:226 (+) Transcript_37569:197-874(+)